MHGCKQNDHFEICPNAIVPCTYSSIGCPETVPRKELLSHLATHTRKSLLYFTHLFLQYVPKGTLSFITNQQNYNIDINYRRSNE